jgi:hypothetical protein
MRLWIKACWLACIVTTGAFGLVGCGGTGSETPEPVHPDSWQLKLRHRRQLSVAAQTDPARNLRPAESGEGRVQARSTWGTDGRTTALGAKRPATLILPDPTAPAEVAPEPGKPQSPATAAGGRKASQEH